MRWLLQEEGGDHLYIARDFRRLHWTIDLWLLCTGVNSFDCYAPKC